jgi:hypothetical protein
MAVLPARSPPNLAVREVHTLFADSLAFVWDGTYLMNYQAAELYDPQVLPTDYPQHGHFTVRAVYRDDPGGVSPSRLWRGALAPAQVIARS